MKKNIVSIYVIGLLLSSFTATPKPFATKGNLQIILAIDTLHIIVFGAHPDDCDMRAGGIAALYSKMGHKVKFVSLTNGDKGHQDMGGGQLANRRLKEAKEAGRRLGIEYEVLDNHDGELMPTQENRIEVIRLIREWKADIVISSRPNDYHPDHRNTGLLVQDAAYLVIVPNILSSVPALKKNPLFLYTRDNFQRPNPFRPDIVVDISSVFNTKVYEMDAHVSQYYEWLPWTEGELDLVPKDTTARRKWLAESASEDVNEEKRASLERWYGKEKASGISKIESFEICEYGLHPTDAGIRRLFPMFPHLQLNQ
ncbi:MAG: PIG-L family deacetylase [Ginsengibacter sp.]